MATILTNDVNHLGPWAWKLMGDGDWFPEGKSAIGEMDVDGTIFWAAIFDNYQEGGSIHIHIAIDDRKYVTRRAISRVFEYPFCQLGVKKVLGFVNSENVDALSFDLRLGFQVEAVIDDVYDRGSLYILSMTREQCRWLRGNQDGKCQESTRAA